MDSLAKGNLLVVDDEEMIRERIELLLEDIADRIILAENGQEALKYLTTEKIHCILCDINMPVMNGIELIKKVRELEMDLPFIFYTGHGSRDLMNEAIKYGAFDFLNKPALENLEDVVQRGLNAGLGQTTDVDEDAILSDYQKLLGELD
jgi:DNA-binding NtrC family response regulator